MTFEARSPYLKDRYCYNTCPIHHFFLPNDVGFKSVAGISAVVAMQPNIHRSVKTISEQAMGNFIGALLAVIVVVVFGKNIVIMGITVILLIAILYKINLAHVATLASVTALISWDNILVHFM